jgi:hypothetical protein
MLYIEIELLKKNWSFSVAKKKGGNRVFPFYL